MASRQTDEWMDTDREALLALMDPKKPADSGAADATAPSAPSAGASRTAWGFTSPTGGKGTLGYTPQDWGGGYDYLEGFDQSKLDYGHPDADSIKYVFGRATQGLAPGANSLDEIIRRLAAQGINAKRVGSDSLDFGLGEGPMDVIRGGTDATGYHGWQWIPGAGGGGGASSSSLPGQSPDAYWTGEPVGGNDLYGYLMTELQKLSSGTPSTLNATALLKALAR